MKTGDSTCECDIFILCSSEGFRSIFKGETFSSKMFSFIPESWAVVADVQKARISVAVSISAGPRVPQHKGERQRRKEGTLFRTQADQRLGFIKSAAPRAPLYNQPCPSAAQMNSILETTERSHLPGLCDLVN